MKSQKGQAAILVVFILGLFSVLIGLTLVENGFTASLLGRKPNEASAALYTAHTGIEDAIGQINLIRPNLGNGTTDTYEFNINTKQHVKVSVSGNTDTRTITSLGTNGLYVKKAVAQVQFSSVIPGFNYAVHAGSEGFELENNSKITGKSNTPGNVYSNGFIKGKNNNHNPAGCQGSSSFIDGTAAAVGNFDGLGGDGVCVQNIASGSAFLKCYIHGNLYGPNAPNIGCPSGGIYSYAAAPAPIPLPDMHIDQLKTFMNRKADTFTGNCVADMSGGLNDCTNGLNQLGNLVVIGNMTVNISNNNILYINGPIWVKGDLILNTNGNGVISVDPTVNISQIFLVDGIIMSNSHVTYASVGSKFLLFLSTYVPSPLPSDLCGDENKDAIRISSNNNSVLFYALNGCALIRSNASFHGSVFAKKIHVSSNANVEYDPALAAAVFGWTTQGGWEVISYALE